MFRRVQFLVREEDRLFILSLHHFLLFCYEAVALGMRGVIKILMLFIHGLHV